MPEIAKLDENGMLVSVETCHDNDHKTCPIARTVALPENHDMHDRAKNYRWDFTRQCFMPLSAEPLDVGERDTPELVEGLIEAIEYLEEAFNLDLPKRTKRVIGNYRRVNPRRTLGLPAPRSRNTEPEGPEDQA